jgi:hypothetical protein
MKARERVALALAAATSLIALAAFVWRVRRGIDFTDEAFYLALPMRFALGDRPFVDELNVAQTSALLIYPLVKLHMLVRGTTGIFWFIRILYVLMFGVIGVSAFRLARTRLPTHAAFLAGAACAPFVPYGVPSLSYNTLGCGLLAAGLFVTTRALLDRGPVPMVLRDPLYWGGFLMGAAAFAYPTLVSSAVVASAAVFVLAGGGRRVSATLRTALGGVTFGLLVSPALLRAGAHGIREALAYSGGGGALSTDKFPILWRGFLGQHPEFVMTFGTAATALALSRRLPRAAALVVLFVPYFARETAVTTYMTSLGFVASLGMLAPLFAFALRDARFGMTLLLGAWLPSACAGAAVAWTSGNGAVAAGLGLYPAAIISVVLMTAWIFELTRTLPSEHLRLAYGFAPLVPLYVMTKLLVADDAVYRDAAVPQLTARIDDGPYKDLLTSPSRRTSLAQTSRKIIALATSKRSVFYYDFPVGYLITQTRPVVPSAWLFPMAPRVSIDARVFSTRAEPGDVVFHLGSALSPETNPLDRAVTERAAPLGYHEGFSVFVVR